MTSEPPHIDTSRPNPARRYNYWLGGKDNFQVDRVSGDEIAEAYPGMPAGVRANRAVLGRMTRYLAGRAGIRQFLDIGTGLPTAQNTHEVAQSIAPECRVVYVDNDPHVMVHARALLTSAPEGVTAYVEADLRDPQSILTAPELRATLDLAKPVGLMLIAVLHFIPDFGNALAAARQLLNALPAGSYLAATHFTLDLMPPDEQATYREMLNTGKIDVWPARRDQFVDLFNGLELVDPTNEFTTPLTEPTGRSSRIVLANQWLPDAPIEPFEPSRISVWAGLGQKGDGCQP